MIVMTHRQIRESLHASAGLWPSYLKLVDLAEGADAQAIADRARQKARSVRIWSIEPLCTEGILLANDRLLRSHSLCDGKLLGLLG